MARSYVPLNVNFFEDPRIMEVTPLARLVFLGGLCIAGRNESNGCVTLAQIRREFYDVDDLAALVDELVATRLWAREGENTFTIPSYLAWNKSREDLDELRAIRAEAGKKGGEAKAKQVAEAKAKQVAKQSPSNLSRRVLATVLNSTEQKSTELTSPSLADAEAPSQPRSVLVASLLEIYPRSERKVAGLRAVEALLESGADFDQVLLATQTYARCREGEDHQFTKLAENFFRDGTWKDYLPGGAGLTKATKSRGNVDTLVEEASGALEAFYLSAAPRDISVLPPLARSAIADFSEAKVARMKSYDLKVALRALAQKGGAMREPEPRAVSPATPADIDIDQDRVLSAEIAEQFRGNCEVVGA